jgi:hypothetical protein
MSCKHVSCGNIEKEWLPYVYMGRERGLKAHLYCTVCGLVKNASSEQPKGMGYYLNIVNMLSRDSKVTKVQLRLISQDLRKQGFDDLYGMDRQCQEALFIDVVKRRLGVHEQAIRKFL